MGPAHRSSNLRGEGSEAFLRLWHVYLHFHSSIGSSQILSELKSEQPQCSQSSGYWSVSLCKLGTRTPHIPHWDATAGAGGTAIHTVS